MGNEELKDTKKLKATVAQPIYAVRVGFNYGPDDARVNAGDPIPKDLPADVLADLIDAGAVEEVKLGS